MRHVSAALGSSSGFLLGMSGGSAGVDASLPGLSRHWPRLRPQADAATGLPDGSRVVDVLSPEAWGAHPVPILSSVRARAKRPRT